MAVKKKPSYPQIKITLKKSPIGCTETQRAVIRGLGLGKINSEVIRPKRPEIMGMVGKIGFMLKVTEVADDHTR